MTSCPLSPLLVLFYASKLRVKYATNARLTLYHTRSRRDASRARAKQARERLMQIATCVRCAYYYYYVRARYVRFCSYPLFGAVEDPRPGETKSRNQKEINGDYLEMRDADRKNITYDKRARKFDSLVLFLIIKYAMIHTVVSIARERR